MAKIILTHEGQLRIKTQGHTYEDKYLVSDAPKVMGGLGDNPSPTDLLAIAWGSCIFTMIANQAKKMNISLEGARLEVDKTLEKSPPYPLSSISADIFCPEPEEDSVKEALRQAANSCPIHHSLHPSVEQNLNFEWVSSSLSSH